MVRSSAGGGPPAGPPRRAGLRLREREEKDREREPRRRTGERERRGETERELRRISSCACGVARTRNGRANASESVASVGCASGSDRATPTASAFCAVSAMCGERERAVRQAHGVRVARTRSTSLRRLDHGIRGRRGHRASASGSCRRSRDERAGSRDARQRRRFSSAQRPVERRTPSGERSEPLSNRRAARRFAAALSVCSLACEQDVERAA